MLLHSLSFENVGPFDKVEFELDPKVNVFTGLNDSGKSTILKVLGEILSYPYALPDNLVKASNAHWNLNYTDRYGNGRSASTNLLQQHPRLGDILEGIGYTCYIPSARLNTGFRASGPSIRKSQDYTPAHAELEKRLKLIHTSDQFVTDEDLVQKIVDLDYRSYLTKRGQISDTIQHVFHIVAEIINSLTFRFIGIDEDDLHKLYLGVRYGYKHGIATDVLGQGIQSLIQIVGRFLLGYGEYYDFPKELEDKPAVLIVDDIDANLQPPWQKNLIKVLTRNFPNIQLFCSVMSPLTISGLQPGQVHYLYFNDDRTRCPRNTVVIPNRHIINEPPESFASAIAVELVPEHHHEDSYDLGVILNTNSTSDV